LIVAALTGATAPVEGAATDVAKQRAPFASPHAYIEGHRDDYDRVHALDLVQLTEFLGATQLELVGPLSLDANNPQRRAFIARVRDEITNRGVSTCYARASAMGRTRLSSIFRCLAWQFARCDALRAKSLLGQALA